MAIPIHEQLRAMDESSAAEQAPPEISGNGDWQNYIYLLIVSAMNGVWNYVSSPFRPSTACTCAVLPQYICLFKLLLVLSFAFISGAQVQNNIKSNAGKLVTSTPLPMWHHAGVDLQGPLSKTIYRGTGKSSGQLPIVNPLSESFGNPLVGVNPNIMDKHKKVTTRRPNAISKRTRKPKTMPTPVTTIKGTLFATQPTIFQVTTSPQPQQLTTAAGHRKVEATVKELEPDVLSTTFKPFTLDNGQESLMLSVLINQQYSQFSNPDLSAVKPKFPRTKPGLGCVKRHHRIVC